MKKKGMSHAINLAGNVSLSEKDIKDLNKLSSKDRQKVLEVMFSREIENVLMKHIPKAIIDGISLAKTSYYEKYVKNLDNMKTGSDEWMECVEKLLSDIRMSALQQAKNQNGKDAEENE